MRRATQHQTGKSSPNRAIASIALCLFSLQLARFYLVIPLDAYTCYSANHTHGESPAVAHYYRGESDHHEEALPPDDHRSYFQHCKDTLNGLGLAPIELFGVPVLALHQKPPSDWVRVTEISRNSIESNIPPPFHPPRTTA